MIIKSALRPDAACRLLWAAAFLDGVLIFVLLQFLGPLVGALLIMAAPDLAQFSKRMDPAIRAAVGVLVTGLSFVVLLLLYWLVTKIVLSGRSFGRMCLMMELRQTDGSKPRIAQITKRGLRKIGSLGLSGTSVRGLDSHDRNNGLLWYSPLAAGQLSATRSWKIEVRSGQYAGTSHVLERLQGYQSKRTVQIGRDPNWADIVLDREEKVSSQHAVLRLGRGGWQIMDYGGGRGSSNKTYVDGRALVPGQWHTVTTKSQIRIAGVEMQLVR
jgi:hypothetical protein